jgi:hypothetical protein
MGMPRRGLAVLAAAALLAPGCGGDDVAVLEEEIHGFRLGERFDDFKDRVGTRISWTEIPPRPAEPRDHLLAVAGTPDHSQNIERARLAFFEGRLMEVILYYRRTGFSQLNTLKMELEERYGSRATAPDGSIEMAYKTWWIKGPGMTITLRRITKKPADELYVQYLHDELHERFKRRTGD